MVSDLLYQRDNMTLSVCSLLGGTLVPRPTQYLAKNGVVIFSHSLGVRSLAQPDLDFPRRTTNYSGVYLDSVEQAFVQR